MINAQRLLDDLKRLIKRLEGDLRQRVEEVPELNQSLQTEWQSARSANRTAAPRESWIEEVITQAAAHWLLSCVFLRFVEDSELVERPWISGPVDSGRLALARDRHEAYFRMFPHQSDRDYLLACFREVGALPGLQTLFDEGHNPVFRMGISGDAAMALLKFWQQVDPNTGQLRHAFATQNWDTRFLGDLYEDLSEVTRKRYALRQTPEFIEEFILDRTLSPALAEFGFREVRLIDPTCGSGHFLLGAFRRLVDEWSHAEPARNRRDIVQKSLDAVAGVDLNPYAVAVARFRLLVAALRACDVHRLTEAPDFKLHVAVGDSLLHGIRFGLTGTEDMFQQASHFANTGLAHAYASEDLAAVGRILGQQYHVVVGNPPYIVVKDKALNRAYRKDYASCYKQYSLGVPFTERFFNLALNANQGRGGGFVGLITADTFMRREFGTELVRQILPQVDLTHVLHAAGVHIPGHNTPTVILFGRHRAPVGSSVRTVTVINGERGTPEDPAQSPVWLAILDQIDRPGSESPFVAAADTPRAVLAVHPWNLGGGGAVGLRAQIEADHARLSEQEPDLGFMIITGEDNCLILPADAARRQGLSQAMPLIEGDGIRDWVCSSGMVVLWPYDRSGNALAPELTRRHREFLWPYRTTLKARKLFGVPVETKGLSWWDLREVYKYRLDQKYLIGFGEVASHNHFAVVPEGQLLNRTAPLIRLGETASGEDYAALAALLNSSVACFWLKQVCFPKGGDQVGGKGARVRKTLWDERYAFNVTNVAKFPVVAELPKLSAARLQASATKLNQKTPAVVIAQTQRDGQLSSIRMILAQSHTEVLQLRSMMISQQEELDWECYRLYGLLPDNGVAYESEAPPPINLGERAFEIVLARRIAAGAEESAWFARHQSKPITEIPGHWPEAYRQLVQRRIELIEKGDYIGLVERPEYKRRWSFASWESLEKEALREWLLNRLEQKYFSAQDQPAHLSTVSRSADEVRSDNEFMHIAACYAGHLDFDVGKLVAELIASEAVPFLPILRYSESGLRKRAQWEECWRLQRQSGAEEPEQGIPVPPKYRNKDFLKSDFWRLRGALDIAQERWISFPGCERGADNSLVIAWAGWNHLQQASALASYYVEMKDTEGWNRERLQPLLAGLVELLPWLEQWHNEIDPVYGERMGTYYKGFIDEEAHALGFTLDELRAWKPQVASTKRSTKSAA